MSKQPDIARKARTDSGPDLERLPLDPKRWRYVLVLLVERYNWNGCKDDRASERSRAERARFLHAQFEWLRDNEKKRYRLDPRSLGTRHIDFILAHWHEEAKAGRISPPTIQIHFEYLKTFTRWIGRPNLMKPIEHYFHEPALYKRSLSGVTDKRAAVVEQLIDEAFRLDEYAGTMLKLMAAFGLNVKQACRFDPEEDVVPCRSASREPLSTTHQLDTHRRKDHERQRYIPIATAAQGDAIEFAKRLALEQNARSSDGNPTLQEAIQRTRRVMQQLGLTRRDLHEASRAFRDVAKGCEADDGAAANAIDEAIDHEPLENIVSSHASDGTSNRMM